MTVIGKSSHALFFNGVSDSVVCPLNEFHTTGVKVPIGTEFARSSRPLVGSRNEEGDIRSISLSRLGSFAVEAWVRPDCGGIVASKEGLFRLIIGQPGRSAPASFSVQTVGSDGKKTTYSATTGSPSSSGFTGITYPNSPTSLVSNNSETSKGTRELIHIAGVFNTDRVFLIINGEIVASAKTGKNSVVEINNSDFLIGGEGGQFRGYIEGVHWRREAEENNIFPLPLVKDTSTIGLWRFEEPVEVDTNEFHLKADAAIGDTILTLDTTQVQTMYQAVSGKSDTLTGTYTLPSMGDYQVGVTTHSDGAKVVPIAHTIANLLINPTCTDVKTGKPNNKPPERVRLKSIDSTGTVLVESIHLDFDLSPNTGSRGILLSRTAFDSTNNLSNDSTIVLLKSDLLLDEGTGQPLQPPGLGSQAIDKNGMTVIDESDYRHHGYLFSRRLSINETTNGYTISSANWPSGRNYDRFQPGHSGRHMYSHTIGHPYLRVFPQTTHEHVIQTIDGMSDIIDIGFDGMASGIVNQVPPNSKIGLFKRGHDGLATQCITYTKATQIIRNGLSTLDPDRDEIIAIGGLGFNIDPFLMKGHGVNGAMSTDDIYNLHLTPEDEPRVAILETGDSNFPCVEIHYNAVDLTGDTMGMNGPALLVTKTVPSGGSVIGGNRVAATIANAISSGKVVRAPGGIIRLTKEAFGDVSALLQSHNLVGDNTGGTQYEVELDMSTLPSNYSPRIATDAPQTPPLGVQSSHSDNPTHPSVYHHVIIRPNTTKRSSTAVITDQQYKLSPTTGNSGGVNQSSNVFEMFDIVDNGMDNNGYYLIVQPTDRKRVMQLEKFSVSIADPSLFSIEFLVSSGRVTSISEKQSEGLMHVTLSARGMMDDIASMQSDFEGRGSPNSTIVKETRPDAPVVTVTLGGPGQGAVETTPTWDKSPLTRLGWNTRRDGGARVTASTSTSLTVAPLNNNSDALASWGTYMFPVRGRIHLENGASAEYYDTTATAFTVKSGDQSGTGRFINSDGSEQDTFTNWLTNNSVVIGQTDILLDPLFDEASIVSDGTTINDRLFQSIGSVAHDYQLGTQYASTRALVEIPVFGNQFFDDPSNGVFPGPDNSMKIHIDPTLTAHSWAPNPVGRRSKALAPADRDVLGPYHKKWVEDDTKSAVIVTKMSCESSGYKIYFSDLSKSFPDFEESISSFRDITGTQLTGLSADSSGTTMHRRIYTPEGEWAIVESNSGGEYVTVNNPLSTGTSEHFWKNFSEGSIVSNIVSGSYGTPIRDESSVYSSANEFRRPYYYDRANVQTQGGNIDYGLRQYVSAVEFKEGPTANPHTKKIESGGATFEIISWSDPNAGYIGDNLPLLEGSVWNNVSMEAINQDDEILLFTHHTDGDKITVSSGTPAIGDIYTLRGLKYSSGGTTNYFSVYDGYVGETTWLNTLNKTWDNPYAPGGLRHGDTVWMNMHYTNPHAIEGLFCKSRGVLNEFLVWNGFNGGRGELGAQARDSIPLENFLIGNTCMETAQNFVQHVNKTVELNWLELGYSASEVPVVAYLDPYLAKEGHARVLLYDVAHDREFIAFHDIHMQVQTGQTTPRVNGLDVANGFYSQDRLNNRTVTKDQSDFIEGAYTHRSSPYMEVTTSGQTHNAYGMNDAYISYGESFLGSTGRTENTTVRTRDSSFINTYNLIRHQLQTTGSYRSTFFDTPDGTRAIPAFLCLKGNRANVLDLTEHSESRLQHLPQWTQMDFVRRLTLDLGEIGQADGVSDVESAVYEMVRRINQAAALQASAEGGSAHDPAPFWDDTAFAGDKGSHMGYLRAHFGRAVKDLDGNDGYTIVIHSTVPGASGRNFCAWLDNSKGQAEYKPQFLVGHGGRFRSFWAMPMEGEDENMHPAPMPITKNGRPFAPITTLRQMLPSDDEDEEFINNLADYDGTNTRKNSEMATGRGANTVYSESFESQGDANRMVEGLRTGTRARARINFGGLVASGVPGWAPDAGPMGFGIINQGGRFDKIYNDDSTTTYSAYVTTDEQSKDEVGKAELYGFKFIDHRGRDHTIRLVYREKGQSFANNNTVLPPSLENEIIISFDDRDISKGGFTIGKHMKGSTYPVSLDPGNLSVASDVTSSVTWRGNTWNGIKAPSAGYPVSGITVSSDTVEIDIDEFWHIDATNTTSQDYLAHLGFPEEGLFIYTDNKSSGQSSKVFRYTSRSHYSALINLDSNTHHTFYGVTCAEANVTAPDTTNMGVGEYATISPMLNWTTIVTDELIAAAVEYAMGVDPNDASAFDCSEMYAPDGRTYKEWMGEGAITAIQVHTLNDKNKVTPLKDLFSVDRVRDLGLYAGNAEAYLTSTQVDDGVVVDVGYLPKTLLNITTRYKGYNSNTVSPDFIKSDGSTISTTEWKKHLRGEKFTLYPGDHITPCINNSIVKVTGVSGSDYTITPWQLLTPYDPDIDAVDNYFSPIYTLYDSSGRWGTFIQYPSESMTATSSCKLKLINSETSFSAPQNTYLSSWGPERDPRAREFAGQRLKGNIYGEPLTYFRGAHDSPDHSVPLYFGGGFSGVVMDVNDGTQNDYTEFYSHPYSSGPTGCAGLQNVGENMGAHAILDTTAMLAMFPGTPFLNQHRGESQPPFTNADALLAPDMNIKSGHSSNKVGNTSQMMGFADENAKATVYQDNTGDVDNQTTVTHPTPVVLRFAHPYARYTDATSGCADEVAYVVFGPGQSVPKHFYGYTNSGQKEPTASKTVGTKYTHVYGDSGLRLSATEPGKYHPNEMSKGWKNSGTYTDRAGDYKPYLPPTMSWQRSAEYPYGVLRNWEPACGTPSEWLNTEFDSSSASLITNHWASSNNTASLKIAHPMFGAGGTGTDSFHYNWHMDGGYPAGGNWMDNAVAKNPTHPTTGNRLPDSQTATFNSVSVTLGLNASMFRVGALALEAYDLNLTENTTGDGTTRDVFVVDATRVQNSEELATIISAAINSYPGEGNLKAMGGTFLPSFQEAIRQDRYSWINVGAAKASGAYSNGTTLTMNAVLPTYIPDKGWIRVVDTTTDNAVFYGRYTAHTPDALNYGVFTLGTNWRSGGARLESPTVALGATASNHDTSAIDANYIVYVWSKTGNLRWSNGAPEALHSSASGSNPDSHIFHHLAATQVHFNGFVDAIDRTRPVGAVGWHGERYSYLNSLKVAKTSSGHGISAGLGAWHPLLGFNPYGSAMGVHALNGATAAYAQTGATASFTQDSTGLNSGLHPRHYVVVSNEAELPIIAKADRDGLILCGDMLDKRWAASSKTGGTVIASHSARHNNDRFAAYAHGGPHVDAQFAKDFAAPSSSNGEWAADIPTAGELYPMESCLFPTGDLFFDRIENPGVAHYPQEDPINHNNIGSSTLAAQSAVLAAPYSFWKGKSAARNFFTNHVVWKRMDGGNLCMPAPNARGLGAVPWVWRKVGSSYVKFGETIYGNTRFSFETTNAAMFPTVQAQELAHPQLAEKYPVEIGAALSIPNEEIQFEAIIVIDDSGQEHKIEGGSPLGTVIRDFSRIGGRDIQGPALAGSGNEPNLSINLPDPNTIPGNILVRSGFDKIQAYQHETMGTGGLQRPDLPDTIVSTNFDSTNENPSTNPFWENEGWERVDNAETSEVGMGFPYSKSGSMDNKAPLQTSYEPHDRALYFHLTKMGWGYTEREPLGIVSTTTDGVTTSTMTHNPLTFISVSGSVLTASGTITASIWQAEQTPDGRSFLTVNGHVVSFTGVSGSTFTGCKFTPGFTATSGDVMKPSFYVPAGSTRHFAARRLRDHAEVSGESPDKAPIDWVGVGPTASPATAIRSDRLTPMPVPRMGHHYVTPTMAVMPGHLSHPLYQRVYNLNRAYQGATTSIEQKQKYASVVESLTGIASPGNDDDLLEEEGVGVNALMWFSSPSSPHPPSDIHGGAFTLMVETKVRYDGYGILAFDDENKSGDHRLKLEAGTNYSTHWNFPDPLETGAYQIIIQPNLFAQQLMGFSTNYDFGADTGTQYPLLTDQQVATVIALQWNGTTYDFVLAEALKADVRGCEVYLNEVMLDIDPSPNQQFTSLPSLALYNPLGVNESTSPAWSRKSLPYYPGMFQLASPGYTLTVPWWSPAYTSNAGTFGNGVFADASNSQALNSYGWRNTEHYHPNHYYHFSRTGYGSIGTQSVMTGYPTHYLNSYLHAYESLNPTCKVKYTQTSSNGLSISNGQILVDNNNLFPEVGKDYDNCKLSVGGYEASYEYRGQASGLTNTTTNRFYGVNGSQQFWDACTENAIITLTGTTRKPGEVYTNKLSSVAAHHIHDLRAGTGDTGAGHLPDAYLSMWHYNLGRPMTYYSDSRGSATAAAVDKAPYNHLPEHYETVHYHDFGYVISDGPFDFRGYGWDFNGDNIESPDNMGSGSGFGPQARDAGQIESFPAKKFHYGAFWPGGSRFGAQASRMDLWGTAGPGWGRFWDSDHIIQEQGTATQFRYSGASGITDSISSVNHKRNAAFGFRFCVRGPFNRPRAALWSAQGFDDVYDNEHAGYRFGPYVQNDAVTAAIYTPATNANTSTAGTESIASGYSGVIERLTNASALIGSDLKGQQVKYSHGRRMCRPFGCAVRNIVNDPYAIRHHQGDYVAGVASADADITTRKRDLATALAHYMTDWWGNTTGEDVRRLPVRGFGIRPAWDPEDAYRATDRTKNAQVFAAPSGHGKARTTLDSFDPATAKRVGDRGDGRGVRWPTVFNEDVLQDVDTIMDATGLVLSSNTAEPSFGDGYQRARNDDLQFNESLVGISRRLDTHAEDGLLKPEAMAGSNVESASNDLLPASQVLQEPISRIAPRIGLDAATISEMSGTLPSQYVAVATEAHSLHTDRVVGRRYTVAGGIDTDDNTKAIGNFNLNNLNFSSYKPVMRLNYTHGIWPMGGTLILDLENYMEPINDLGWGASSGRGSNPYQSGDHNSLSYRTNPSDKLIRFLLRPVRVLDHRHVEVFRDKTNALSGTAGGKYGLFTYSTPNAIAATSSRFLRSSNPAVDNPPYAPAYFFASGGAYTATSSSGPNIPGTEASGFANSLKQTVARISISDNTLQHLRADANRRGDFTVQPRYTQSLYPGINLNKSDHSGESSHTDNEVDG